MIQRSPNRVSDLQKTLDEIDAILGKFSAIGENLNQTALVREILKKFPHHVILRIEERRTTYHHWTMSEIWMNCENI